MRLRIPPLGLAYIAAATRENGHEVKMKDLGIRKNALTPDLIKWADIIGISADTPGYPEALTIADISKKQGKIVVMGGYHVTFLDKEALETGLVDFIVRGEGEEIFIQLLSALQDHRSLNDIDGISYKQDGVYIRNKDNSPPFNLDQLPLPARDLLPMQEYKSMMNGWKFTSLITSRGCPFSCNFCSSSKFGGLKWRARSAKSIVDEMEHLVYTYGYRAFSLMDDNFTLNPQRVFEFADELEKRKMTDIRWWCFSRVDILVKNEPMIKRMAETGAYMVFLGLESNNEKILQSYRKHVGNEQQQEAIRLLNKYRIEIHASYILGNVRETKAMAENTIKWAEKVGAKSNQFSLLTPYPGTVLYEDVRKENRFLHKNWKLYNGLFPVIKLDHLTPKQTGNLLFRAYQNTFLNCLHLNYKKIKITDLIKHLPGKINSLCRVISVLLILKLTMRRIT
jgi:anaerobic magnesium-protoporphyrin IX monomethyl ester cyclase